MLVRRGERHSPDSAMGSVALNQRPLFYIASIVEGGLVVML